MGAQPGVIATAPIERDERLVTGGLPLSRGSTLRVEDGRETLARVRSGCVWITQEHELRDEILESGQQFRISRDGCTLITALKGSLVELEFPHGKPLPRRIELSSAEAARLAVLHESRRVLRSSLAALGARLREMWLGLYARPPRRAAPLV